jgi:DNA helicase-2/ATP-dependent DNA helicase PcrA
VLQLFPDRLAHYQRAFRHVLVDEFQDTNRAQYELIRFLGVQHRNVFGVGDEDQSIYGWRGADLRNMQDLQKDFGVARIVKLEENYRSTRPILDAANAVISRNVGRIGKTLRPHRPGGTSIIVTAAADERDEAEWIAKELQARQRDGTEFVECAILYRTNAQSRALEEAFRRAGVPYRIVGAISFYDRREVKDLLAYLRLIANPADDEAFLRAVGVPRRGLGESSLTVLGEHARRWNLPLLAAAARGDAIAELRPNLRAALRTFADVIDGLRVRVGESAPANVMEEVIRTLDYEALLTAEGLEGIDRWENVRELLAAAAEVSEVVAPTEEEGTPLQRFLAEAALLSAIDQGEGREDGVTMMTLHTSKGLEWPIVVISGVEEGLFPSGRALESLDGLEEERRLCYVGITRAKDVLMLTWARARRRGGELRPATPSRFLRELPAELLEERRTSFAVGGIATGSGWRTDWGASRSSAAGRTSAVASPRSFGSLPPRADDDHLAAARLADAGSESQVAPRYIKGERVRHRRFGGGAILGLTGSGKDLMVSVAFDDPETGTKQLLVAFAGLERDLEGA